MALRDYFPKLTRDDAKWVWAQFSGLAVLVIANTANLPAWFAYIGLPISEIGVHRLSVAAAIILYIGGRYGTSPLPRDYTKPPSGV